MTRTAVKLLVAGILLVYPIAVYLANGYLTPSQLLAGLLLLLAGRVLVIVWINATHRIRNALLAGMLLLAAILVLLLLPAFSIAWLRFYPVLFNLAAFGLFFGSLFTRMPLAERMARLVHPELPPQGVAYTRYVTWVWSGVMLFNTLVSLYTSFATSFRFWSLYNGVLIYVLFGGVFLSEYLVRTWLRRKWAAPS